MNNCNSREIAKIIRDAKKKGKSIQEDDDFSEYYQEIYNEETNINNNTTATTNTDTSSTSHYPLTHLNLMGSNHLSISNIIQDRPSKWESNGSNWYPE